MLDELNRFTLNCANLLQSRRALGSDRRQLSWMAFNPAITKHYSRFIPGITSLSLFHTQRSSSAPFLQFGSRIFRQPYFYFQLPSVVPMIEQRKEGGSKQNKWPELWMGLTDAFHRFSQQMTPSTATPIRISLTPSSTQWSTANVTTRPQFSMLNTAQQSMIQPFENSLTSPNRQYAFPGISTSHHLSILNSVQQGITQGFAENILQNQWIYRDRLLQNYNQSIANTITYQSSIASYGKSIFLEASSFIPASSNLPTGSTTFATSEFSGKDLSTLASQQTLTINKLVEYGAPRDRHQKVVEEPASPASLTLNGGIHVQITAQTVDQAHADETARQIASQVVKEINRLTDQSRFRRGLPSSNNS